MGSSPFLIPFLPAKFSYHITNPNGQAVYYLPLALPPFGQTILATTFVSRQLLGLKPQSATIMAGETNVTYNIEARLYLPWQIFLAACVSFLIIIIVIATAKPGVYIFKNAADKILYIGKAKSLRDRVKSYFQPPVRLGPKTAQLVSQINAIDHVEVASELEALLLESRLIKKFQPHYNIISKDGKSPILSKLRLRNFPNL